MILLDSTLPESLRKAFGLLEGPMRRNSREQAKPGKDDNTIINIIW